MSSRFRKKLNAVTLPLVSVASFGFSGAASAATGGNLTVTGVTPQSSVCGVNVSFTVTGTVADVSAGGIDYDAYGLRIIDRNGLEWPVTGAIGEIIEVGVTENVPNYRIGTSGSRVPAGVFTLSASVALVEQDAAGNTLGILQQQSIPGSLLQNAGPACAHLFSSNVPPVADAGPDLSAVGGSLVTTQSAAFDPDSNSFSINWTQVSGPSISIQNPNSTSARFIAPPKTNAVQTLTLQLSVDDGTDVATDTVDVFIVANIGPTASATAPTQAVSGSTVTLDGSASQDGDGDTLNFSWAQTSGPTVTLSDAFAPRPTFTAPPRTSVDQTLSFVLQVDDGFGGVDVANVSVIVPANVAPTANAGSDITAEEGTTVTLDGAGSDDAENDTLTYAWTQLSGPAVTLSNAAAINPSFSAPAKANVDQTLVFQLVVNDGIDNSVADTVTVTVPANVAPTADAGADISAIGAAQVTLDGSNSDDPEGDNLSFSWSQSTGVLVALSPSNSVEMPSFTAPSKTAVVQNLVFDLVVNDGLVDSPSDSVTVSIPANIAPVANAGSDISAPGGTSVTLDGSGSNDPENDSITYMWTQISGASVSLNDDTLESPVFTAPAATPSDQTLAFRLEVNDGIATTSDTVTVTIPSNIAPVVNAGIDQTVSAGSTVTLSGTANDHENDPLTYVWNQTSGPSVALSGDTTLSPSFTAPAKTTNDQTLVFELIANDGTVDSVADTVSITVPANIGPVADAGADATIAAGDTVTLDGSGSSDGDGDTLTYAWTQTGGPAVTLSDSTSVNPSFTAPAKTANDQVISFELVVSDGVSSSTAGVVSITIPANIGPTADAGADATAAASDTVTLDGSASSDGDGDTLTYAWTQTGGPAVTLSDATSVSPSFTAPAKTATDQVVSFELVVSDGVSSSAAAAVSITIPANVGPVADAGADINTTGGATALLDGTGSTDGDGDLLTYTWTQVSGPSVTLSDANVANPSFTVPAATTSAQTLAFELVVSDGIASSVADSVTVTVAANNPPVANAGADIGPINSGELVRLDGSGSSDPDGDALTYRWSQVSGTAATLSDTNSVSPSFTAPLVNANETLTFQLIVNDGVEDSPADTISVAVQAVGTITLVQQITGEDTSVTYSSSVAGLNGTITTVAGTASLEATSVPAGAHTVSAEDLTPEGYALTGIACSDTDSVVDVASRSVAINLSPAEDLTCTFTSANTRDAALKQISDFMSGRAGLILANQPDAGRRIGRLEGAAPATGGTSIAGFRVPGSSYLPAQISIGQSGGKLSTSLAQLNAGRSAGGRSLQSFDLWGELTFGSAEFGSNDYDYQIAHIGADWLVSDTALIGLMGQYDKLEGEGAAPEGDGWMIGPYATVKLSDNLFGDVRAAWGSSDNTVSPLGTFRDGFETDRALYSGSLIGVYDVSDVTRFRPELALRYYSEEQSAYVDSYGVKIPSQSLDQGDVAFSPRFDTEIDLNRGWALQPFIAADGIYTFGSPDEGPLEDALRARIEIGGILFKRDGFGINLSANFDGIGAADYQSTGFLISLARGF